MGKNSFKYTCGGNKYFIIKYSKLNDKCSQLNTLKVLNDL